MSSHLAHIYTREIYLYISIYIHMYTYTHRHASVSPPVIMSPPPHTTRGIPFSLALRAKRIISDPTKLIETHDTLTQQLVQRNYNPQLVRQQIQKADRLDCQNIST